MGIFAVIKILEENTGHMTCHLVMVQSYFIYLKNYCYSILSIRETESSSTELDTSFGQSKSIIIWL